MDKILILMSTYNGCEYLAEQLDSILFQQNVKVHLLIRDDGSVDTTISIIKAYQDKFPTVIEYIEGNNVGWRKSYFLLLQYAYRNIPEYKYYAFADQDDIWLPDKLKQAVKSINTLPDGPNLYCSNLIYYKNGQQCGLVRDKRVVPSYKSSIIRNYATGCTTVFNRKLLELINIKLPEIRIAHDYWCYLAANYCGSVIIDNEAFILYRQHNTNQIGSKKGFFQIWKRRLHSLSDLVNNHDKEMTAVELLEVFGDDMDEMAKNALIKVANYKKSFWNRISLLFDNEYSYKKSGSDFWLKIKIICGKL